MESNITIGTNAGYDQLGIGIGNYVDNNRIFDIGYNIPPKDYSIEIGYNTEKERRTKNNIIIGTSINKDLVLGGNLINIPELILLLGDIKYMRNNKINKHLNKHLNKDVSNIVNSYLK